MDESQKDSNGQPRSACTECQRRKQKCNREWPCNHCQKRKVADKCRFNTTTTAPDKTPHDQKKSNSLTDSAGHGHAHQVGVSDLSGDKAAQPRPQASTKKKRQLERDGNRSGGETEGEDDDDLGLGNIGYMATHQFASLGISGKQERQNPRLFLVKASGNSHLQRALEILPERAHMDAMVQNFFDNVNYHYYIIYPPVFLQEYKEWWVHRSQGWVLSLQWTCLLLTVCSCACQHLPVDVQEKLELEIGETASQLSERYHDMARELGNATPVGYYHMYNVQWLLHSTYWFKAEARFLECWHVLGAAAREAQELGFHKKEAAEHLPEFEREMRRRVWCVIDCWDWQISSGLFRPTIIDHTDCTVELPTLTLEDFSPSPLMHMKLQSELIHSLAARFGAPKNITSTEHVREYKKIIDDWMQRFPPAYALEDPDTSGDKERPWIRFHRHYIHTMGYMMLLNPIRPFMALTITRDSPPDELAIRATGVDYALREMDVLRDWVDFVSYRDGRFHFIIFALFDTSAVLSTALIKDEAGTIPCRNEIYNMIDSAVIMLKELMTLSPTAKMSYDILSRIVRKVPRPRGFRRSGPRQRYKGIQVTAPRAQVPPSSASPSSSPPASRQQRGGAMPSVSRIQVPVQPTLPPSPASSTGGVYVPVQPPMPASTHHLPVHTGVRVPVQPTICAPPAPQASIHVPVQPPPAPVHQEYFDAGQVAPSGESYVPPSYTYDATLVPQQSGFVPSEKSSMMAPVPPNALHNVPMGSPSAILQADCPSHVVLQPQVPELPVTIFHTMDTPSSENYESPPAEQPVEEQFDRITNAELGALATLWNWQSLNLPFIGSETTV